MKCPNCDQELPANVKPRSVLAIADCPQCKQESRFRHTHDSPYGLEGAHMGGSERFECAHCDFVVRPDMAKDFPTLTFVLDKDARNLAAPLSAPLRHTMTDGAWPPRDVVAKLVEAVGILLDKHSYDGHGHELIGTARDVANRWLAALGDSSSRTAPTREQVEALLDALCREVQSVSMLDSQEPRIRREILALLAGDSGAAPAQPTVAEQVIALTKSDRVTTIVGDHVVRGPAYLGAQEVNLLNVQDVLEIVIDWPASVARAAMSADAARDATGEQK